MSFYEGPSAPNNDVTRREPSAPNGDVTRRGPSASPAPKSAMKLSTSPRDCSQSGAGEAHEPHVAPDEYFVDTDAQGSFCVLTSLPLERGTMALRYEGSALYDKTAAEIAFDLGTPAITL